MSTTVGIVVVSYNAAQAVRATLASVRRARNATPYKLLLVDNASELEERAQIEAAMARHMAAPELAWRYLPQGSNLGFSGGNNVGIAACLADPDISHVCLLNSDVIVTDHWLDRLLADGADIVSAVTNKADGEQCVPVDYDIAIADCLDPASDTVPDAAWRLMSDFADRRHAAWQGNLVEADPTFFCVLLRSEVVRQVGLLDETFFPGGFEDDDYCLRARQAGWRLHLARGAFIHHWGSASFGQLQYAYFSERAQRNKAYLERKHGITWKRRPERPVVSFAMDIVFALRGGERLALQAPFIEDYLQSLERQLAYFESEFGKLSAALAASARSVPDALAQQVAQAAGGGGLEARWNAVAVRTRAAVAAGRAAPALAEALADELAQIAAAVHARVDANFAIHGFLTAPDATSPAPAADLPPPSAAVPPRAARPAGGLARALWMLRRGLSFLWRFEGIVFFGGYFYPERQGDGYFQRIQIVDRLFKDRWRVYVESSELRGRDLWFDNPEPYVLVLRVQGSRKRRALVRLLALLAVLRVRNVYFHSVLRMHDNRFGRLLHLPFLRKVVDIHGVVPEEFRMHDDFFSALLYEREERRAVRHAGLVVVVTDAMRQYLQQKFRGDLRARTANFPMFPSFTPTLAARPLVDGKPVVVYAGGLHKWQQVPKMLDAMARTADRCAHRFYCPEPDAVRAMLPPGLAGKLVVESRTHAELMALYPQCHYGFILREGSVVNRVACPTKLVEYLAMGIVPIVDDEGIGDFKALGMGCMRLDDFLAGRLPDEAGRAAMAQANLAVYERLKQVRQDGALAIQGFFGPAGAGTFGQRLRRWLPPHSLAGRVARRLARAWRAPATLQPAAAPAAAPSLDAAALAALPACDVLVQVDNFEAGGLENVVLGLNGTLAAAGLRVVLLVQGIQGAAVQRARALGQAVVCAAYDPATHAALLDRLRPRVVLAHYSFTGIEACRRRGIAFVQVLHNIYMWFDAQQRRDFAEQAARTTAFVAVSDYVRRYSVARLGVPAERCVVVPNGIDFAPFEQLDAPAARRSLRARHGIPDEAFVFLDVGAVNHQKNHLGVLRAFALAARECADARLVVLGPTYEAQLLQELREEAAAQGLADRVLYAGAAPAVHEYLAMADAFVAGSFFEGAQLSLLEAVRANLPIVTANVGNASGFAGRRGITLVAPAVDIAAYAGAIWELRSDAAFEQRLAQAMAETWRDPVRPDFSPMELAELDKSRSYARYTRFVSELMAQDAQGAAPAALLKAA